MSDLISRQAAIDVIEREQFKGDAISEIEKLPPVQPKYNPDEWCRTCSEYDHDKHCCPRYNKVIRSAVEEIKEPCEEKIIEWKKDFKEYVNSLSMLNDDYKGIMEYIDELPVTSQETCENAINIQAAIDALQMRYVAEPQESEG